MDNLKQNMLLLGYSLEEIDRIINHYALVNYKKETLLDKIQIYYDYLLGLGYNKNDIIKMTYTFPQIYGLAIENIKNKIEYFKYIGYQYSD